MDCDAQNDADYQQGTLAAVTACLRAWIRVLDETTAEREEEQRNRTPGTRIDPSAGEKRYERCLLAFQRLEQALTLHAAIGKTRSSSFRSGDRIFVCAPLKRDQWTVTEVDKDPIDVGVP